MKTESSPRPLPYVDAWLVEALRACRADLGKWPMTADYRRWVAAQPTVRLSVEAMVQHAGNWRAALDLAGAADELGPVDAMPEAIPRPPIPRSAVSASTSPQAPPRPRAWAVPTEFTADRVVAIHREYMDGLSLAELSERYGRSRERFRQLFARYRLPKREGPPTWQVEQWRAQREAREAKLRARTPDLVAAYRRLGSMEAAALEVGIENTCARRIIRDELADDVALHRRRPSSAAIARDSILAALREARDLVGGPVLSNPAYARLRATRRPDWPSVPTVVSRLGSWTAALDAAGVPRRTSSGVRQRFSEAACLDAIVELRRRTGGWPTSAQYGTWAAGTSRPSNSTIVKRFGTWTGALRAAAELSEARRVA